MSSDVTPMVGVDWGSSSFRAYLFDETAQITDRYDSDTGIKLVEDRDFEKVLFNNIGHWLHPGVTVLFSGMITSRDGWIETPYLEAPVNLGKLLNSAVSVTIRESISGIFLPGVCSITPDADVMRGEEIQLFGAVTDAVTDSNTDSQLVVLPGTHSKWARIQGAVLQEFHTIITGELFDLLLNHSLVGGLSDSQDYDEPSFREGVQRGHADANIVTRLFAARSSVLVGSLQSSQVYSYLSGVLIGNEIREARRMISQRPVVLVGSESLVEKYHTAFETLAVLSETGVDHAAARGFQKLIKSGAL